MKVKWYIRDGYTSCSSLLSACCTDSHNFVDSRRNCWKVNGLAFCTIRFPSDAMNRVDERVKRALNAMNGVQKHSEWWLLQCSRLYISKHRRHREPNRKLHLELNIYGQEQPQNLRPASIGVKGKTRNQADDSMIKIHKMIGCVLLCFFAIVFLSIILLCTVFVVCVVLLSFCTCSWAHCVSSSQYTVRKSALIMATAFKWTQP